MAQPDILKSSYLEIFKREIKNLLTLPIKYTFLIEFGPNFSTIKIYVRHYMTEFEYTKKKFYCIKISNPHQYDQFQFQFFQNFIQPNTRFTNSSKHVDSS